MTKARKTTKAKKANGTAKSKTAQVVQLMRRAKGVTRAEVLELTGWQAINMNAVAKAAHVKIRIDKSSFPYRYRCNGD
jgi:hypothetical protein